VLFYFILFLFSKKKKKKIFFLLYLQDELPLALGIVVEHARTDIILDVECRQELQELAVEVLLAGYGDVVVCHARGEDGCAHDRQPVDTINYTLRATHSNRITAWTTIRLWRDPFLLPVRRRLA